MPQPCSPYASKMPLFISKQTFSFLFILFILAFFTTLHHYYSHHQNSPNQSSQNTLFFLNTFLSSATNYTLATYLRHLTLHPHLAGTTPSLNTALYVKSHFESLNLQTHVTNYSVLLSYPLFSSVTLHFPNGSVLSLTLSEPGSSQNGVIKPYHAYSPSGSAYGKPVFLNYGREKDYVALSAQGVKINGCVGLARRGGGLSRNEVVEKAAARGVTAVLMFTDSESEYASGVERGTVMSGLGDPLSPGWGAGGEKLRLDDPRVMKRFPSIPSLPISMASAESILKSLEGADMPYEWRMSMKCSSSGRVGPGPFVVNFTYEGERKMATVHNVFAVIRGSEEPDRFVLLGNHRDAWTYGAVDPNSGTAALLDIARRYALLMRLGWNPRRTIILCSWDAEEFGMIGSTEWVEQNLVNLGSKSVAYLNVDCAVQGPGFFPSTTPQLDDLLTEITKKVNDPDSEGMTLYERWTTANRGIRIQRLSGVDSDFASFLHHAGVPSVDLYYGKDFPVYHTAFDSYSWMVNFGDPFFQRHVAVTGVWGLLALRLAEDPILPFNYLTYAVQLQDYTHILSDLLEGGISLHPITAAIQELAAAAIETLEEAKKLKDDETTDEHAGLKQRMLNDRLMLAERGFLDAEGLQGKPWFKHMVYGPRNDGESELDFFPGIANAISRSSGLNSKEHNEAIQHEIWRTARAIQRAAHALKGELT
ncbi:PREDICTED: probable glutamate carboxypeptidase 2 [Nicotiana attenuata]|uniref:glutamate carboxypeptidase II n=1 Tax=Nicotiana attenuata TaxID=49451 RepID=A0A1J6IUC9_NICAT|nr:PREDICTED: probable glutamate carboxypeptidase 2 [Nicotiana attenuata]OIT08338.1 putative glutamate carboxypeptidase 2 [Nicotiana attenuata]